MQTGHSAFTLSISHRELQIHVFSVAGGFVSSGSVVSCFCSLASDSSSVFSGGRVGSVGSAVSSAPASGVVISGVSVPFSGVVISGFSAPLFRFRFCYFRCFRLCGRTERPQRELRRQQETEQCLDSSLFPSVILCFHPICPLITPFPVDMQRRGNAYHVQTQLFYIIPM